MIQLNHPDREKVKPLSKYELENSEYVINKALKVMDNNDYPLTDNSSLSDKDCICILQNLISSYQNLQHFWDVAGGWEGLNALQKQSECNVTEAEHSALGYPYHISDMNVEYEIVKPLNLDCIG